MQRIGQGFDLHRLEVGLPLMLGGLEIESDKGSYGHSDGDVVLHALCDALLGALGLGDIGEWFPPGEAHTKGEASHVFVTQIMEKVTQQGWGVTNVDVTVFLEEPKLSGYKKAMAAEVARLLHIAEGDVNIKAKTMEGLGAIGQQQAVAASVTVLLHQV